MNRVVISLLVTFIASSVFAQNAADAFYDPAEMAKARAALKSNHGGQLNSLILGERLEYQSNDGNPLSVWEAQGWVGGDIQKLWFKTEGEYEVDEGRFEEAEVQALYSRAISPFWDLQAGIRHDIKPDPSRNYAVIGAQGLAPYWFEFDGQLFMSDEGDLSARLEAEYEFRLTQRLMLQPRLELNGAFSDDEDIGVGSGLSTAAAGLRLRYEITREFAPYIGISWNRTFGKTQDFVRAEGEDSDQVSWVAGVRFWF
ncbi:MAG: copper resistance protein B [Pseudomonadaceae bacterium]|nr:copper resistance protein B [Pseudomonadaceae bacterium]